MEEQGDDPAKALDKVTDLVQGLAQSFSSHPGFMWTDSGFEVLHADWPAYPRGHGREALLDALAEYPPGTAFFKVDNIDMCTLFAVGRQPENAKTAKTLPHVAIWDEDLRLGARRDYLDGVRDEDEFLQFGGSMTLSSQGEHAILLHELTLGIPDHLLDTVWDHLESRRYDTAVREAAVLLEVRMKRAAGSTENGWALVDRCFGPTGYLLPPELPNASRLNLNAAFRTFFSYVRNEYAHNIPEGNAVTSCRHIRRCARLLRTVETLASQRTR